MGILVAYFSAESGKTAGIAKDLAGRLQADLFEIRPEKPYTHSDLNYMNPLARCNREKLGGREVPVAGNMPNLKKYDTVYLGFPIWYGAAPNVVNTFCRQLDWSGITVHAFATSGGSGIGKTAQKLAPCLKGAALVDAKLVEVAGDI
ncbi:MAG: flavodoxin [Clostridia bacterium]|nr:flavodoxin [Clostridia bacterium]